jgi:FMN phosphatase YigB (HAD superfamily)
VKIFIDFDDTLFNAKKFKRSFEDIFIEQGISRKNFRKTYDQAKKKAIYFLENHIYILESDFVFDKKIIKSKLKLFFSDLTKFIYTDSWKFLNQFPRKDLFILSFGQHSFQRKKIKGSKTDEKVSKIIITQSRKIRAIHEFVKKYNCHHEKLIFIDNKAEFLEKVEKVDHKILMIQMMRNKSEKIAKHADYRVRNFNEAIKIINKEKLK